MDWKEEFKILYFSPNVADIPKALELKRVNMPSKLYRYRPLNNLEYFEDEVVNAHVYLANPKMFNDPFDSSSVLQPENIKTSEELKNRFKESFKNFADRKDIRYIFNSKHWFERMCGYYANVIAKENSRKTKHVDELKDVLAKALYKEVEKWNEFINSMSTSFSKVTCFTENNINLPMWNHYANAHKGICLEYDMSNSVSEHQIKRMFPVFYVNELPDGIRLVFDGKINRFNSSDYLLLHKLIDWSYEKEWRLVYDASFWYDRLVDIPESFYDEGRVIDFIKPSKIYLGYQITDYKEAFVREVCKKHNIYVVKMKCTNYGLRPEDEI
ncbi:MAG: DUF2971 domain-containing protein [Phascolarctobacterium sp.]|nr:DUF2971 domain-containing protein [Phascolarctobacterium sp.]